MTPWEYIKKVPRLLMLEEIAAFILCILGIYGFFLLAYAFLGG